MRKFIMVATAVCCLSSGAYGEEKATVKDVVGWAREGDQEFISLITGVGRGVEGVNMIMGFRKQPTLYCQPNTAVTGEQFLRIIELHIERNPEEGKEQPGMIGIVMAVALREAFPCK